MFTKHIKVFGNDLGTIYSKSFKFLERISIMPRPIFAPYTEKDIFKKIREVENAHTITCYVSVRVGYYRS